MRRVMRAREGVTAIETALLLPLLLIILFGIIEFSILFYDKAMITNASREGARVGIAFCFDPATGRTHPPDSEIIAAVNQYCQNFLITFGSASAPNTAIARTGNGAGDSLTVRVTYTYDFLVLPNFLTSLGGAINLDATTVMRLE